MKADYLIIGNSAAGLSAAESIRLLDSHGSILVLTEENFKNYSKPLITYYLAGKVNLDQMYYRSPAFYAQKNIMLCTDTCIVGMNTEKKEVISAQGRKFSYNKLLIASGGIPVLPPIPVSGGGLLKDEMKKIEGIYTLTTLEDARRLKKYIEKNHIRKAVVLGAGLIGLKAAEACLELGLTIHLIELSDRILAATFDHKASKIMEARIEQKQGRIYTSNTIKQIKASQGTVEKLILADGKQIDTNLLIAAVGVRPHTAFIDAGTIETERGIIVDKHMQTTAEHVYAAGDVASSTDILKKRAENIAIWPLAVMQGRVAGMNMAGKRQEYGGGFFMNAVEIMGIPSISMGLSGPQESKDAEVLTQEDGSSSIYRKVVIEKNRIVGLIMLGHIERAGIYAGLIKNRIDIGNIKENIIREDFGLIQLPADYKKHLVVGEGIEV